MVISSKKKIGVVLVLTLIIVFFGIIFFYLNHCRKVLCLFVFDRGSFSLLKVNQKNLDDFLEQAGSGGKDTAITVYANQWKSGTTPEYVLTNLRPIVIILHTEKTPLTSGFPLLYNQNKSVLVAAMKTTGHKNYVKIDLSLVNHPPIVSTDGKQYDNLQVAISSILGLTLFDVRYTRELMRESKSDILFSLLDIHK